MSEIEMNTYEGQCKYCGNIQPIMAMDQIDANEQISEKCDCGGAETERRKASLLKNLNDVVGKNAPNYGMRQVEPEQEEIITQMALAVFNGLLERASCKIDGITIAIVRAGGKTKIKRMDQQKAELEA
ncbi:MAG: hypothetical protein SOR93_14170 [Clostridiales Family XIII bacterium]|uniref:hypothetical protein n=1 Tax=Hominibacterium faecale TaxID=2839743 RepID=UPI0022B2A3E2|nr:hypothetical protein [Hominibacterium faecale]MCI7300999.1 hypothetical protein [Clostridia bacterium]MDY3012384.1 hypothetical protein [Clostridiales Family XIII bacterium]